MKNPPRSRAYFHYASFATTLVAAAIFSSPASADSDRNTCYINIDPHPCMSAEDPVAACTAALDDDPYNMQTRLSLCGAHLQDGDNEESNIDAYIVVKKGIEMCGPDRYVCQRYKYAKSMIEEGDDGTRRQQTITARERCDYGRDLCLSRLTSNLGVRGCDLALICDADDPALFAKKGEKLLSRARPAEAVAALRTANMLDKGNEEIQTLLTTAQKARAELAAVCVKGSSVEDCNNALLAGEPDEFDVQYRRGRLFLIDGRQPAALQAFINAQSARPGDEELARELLEALGPALDETPDNVTYLAAQGLAQMTVGKADESIVTLSRAQQLSPDDEEIDGLLAAARTERAGRVKRDCLSRKDPNRCYAMIISGEPDEVVIRAHVAGLQRDAGDLDAALTEAQKAARLAPDDATVAALVAGIRELQAPPPEPEPEPVEVVVADNPEPVVEQAEPEPAEVADEPVPDVPAPVIYSNAVRDDGRTY